MCTQGESDIRALFKTLETDPGTGLTEVEASNRLERFGTNEIERPYLVSVNVMWAAIFCFVLGVVLGAEGLSGYGLCAAAVGIALTALAIDLGRRYQQEASFGDQVPEFSLGLRSGKLMQLRTYELVPGDVVRLQAGDIVPADGRLIEAVSLLIQEAAISGDHDPVIKDALPPDEPTHGACASQNRVFKNTVVIEGRGTFVVTETGRNTWVGRQRNRRGSAKKALGNTFPRGNGRNQI